MSARLNGTRLDGVDIDLTILIVVAAVWLSAGIVADGLPGATTTRALRRRTRSLYALTAAGLAALTAVGLVGLLSSQPAAVGPLAAALAPMTLPAGVVAALTVRRLRRLSRGAAAFATAPRTPVPPALRAGAAHPMVALPLQVTGLVALPATVSAVGIVPLDGPGRTGPVLTAAVLSVAAIGVRHALRHSRLAERAVTVRAVTRYPSI